MKFLLGTHAYIKNETSYGIGLVIEPNKNLTIIPHNIFIMGANAKKSSKHLAGLVFGKEFRQTFYRGLSLMFMGYFLDICIAKKLFDFKKIMKSEFLKKYFFLY